MMIWPFLIGYAKSRMKHILSINNYVGKEGMLRDI